MAMIDQSTLDQALGSDVTGELKANREKLSGLTTAAQKAQADASESKQAEMKIEGDTASQMNEVRQKLADFKPRESTMEKPTAPDFKSNEPSPKQMQDTAGMLMVVAGLMGAFSRQGYTAALNNMTGALQGFQEGNAEATKKNLDEYKTHVEEFKTKLEAFKRDRAELDKMDQSDIAGLQRFGEFIAHKNDAPLLAQKAKTGSYTDFYKAMHDQMESTQKVIEKAETSEQGMRRTLVEHTLKRQDKAADEAGGGAGGAAGLTPQALDDAAEKYRITGVLPSLGMGKSAASVRVGIMNKAAQSAIAHAQSGSQLPADQAKFKSTAAALTNNTKDLAAITPYVEMLDKNADIAIDLSQKVVQSDSRFANKTINWLKQNGGDNPDTAEYLAQMRFVQTEAARVLNNPRLTGQLSDSARQEMEQVVSGDMPINSTARVLNRIKADGKNRFTAIEHENQRLMEDMHGGGAKPGGAAPPLSNAKGWKLHQDAKGNKAYVGPNGEVEEVH